MTGSSSAVTAEVAKKCDALTAKAFPPLVPGNPAAGTAKGTGQSEQTYFRKCVENGGKMDEFRPGEVPTPRERPPDAKDTPNDNWIVICRSCGGFTQVLGIPVLNSGKSIAWSTSSPFGYELVLKPAPEYTGLQGATGRIAREVERLGRRQKLAAPGMVIDEKAEPQHPCGPKAVAVWQNNPHWLDQVRRKAPQQLAFA
jgi:hypothetical protein